jgi:cyanophycin synthetase
VRIPVVAMMAGDGSRAFREAIAQALSENEAIVGLATSDGVTIGGMRYTGVDGRNPSGPRTVLNNPSVDVAVVDVDAESIILHGLGFDACDAV